MKHAHASSVRLKAGLLRHGLVIAALALFSSANADQTQTPRHHKPKPATDSTADAAAVTDIPPTAKTMAEFAQTPEGKKRKREYGKNFGEKGRASKDIKYPDGTSLHLHMIKNPKFGGQATSIMAHVHRDKKEKPEHHTDSKGQEWTCTTDHVQLTATSTTFLNNDYSSSAAHIYPGACYTFDDFYNGSYKEQAGDRNPITIVTDNPNIRGSSYRTIQEPNMGTVMDAVHKLFQAAAGKSANESLTFQIYETANDADQSIKISGGASGYGVSLSGGYKTSGESKTMTLTIDAIKTLFSITTTPPKGGFFKDPKVEATPNLMVIGSVSYGIRVLANMTVTFNSAQEEADFAAAYSGFGVSANFSLDQISKSKAVSSTINCYVVGGPGNSTVTFDKKDLQREIEKVMAGATYANAKPVKYEFYDMGGDVIGSRSATDSFAVRNCTPGKNDPRLESVAVQFSVGSDNKNPDDNYTLLLWPGNANIDPKKQYGDMVFQFNEAASPEGMIEYQSNSSYTVKMDAVNKPATLSQFTKNGGQVLLSIFPSGNDTWDIATMQMTLTFDGGNAQTVRWSNISIDQNGPHRVLYFDGNFKAQ